MIAVLKSGLTDERREQLMAWLKDRGLRVSAGESRQALDINGDMGCTCAEQLRALDGVEAVLPSPENRPDGGCSPQKEEKVICCGKNAVLGGGRFAVMAGPCAVENEAQLIGVARRVQAAGAHFLRGGAFKPRTSPYDFQGLGEQGLKLLYQAKKETGLPVVTEITDIRTLPLFEEADVIQVGARNTQNYELLKELGRCHKPVLLKRGLAGTIRELLMSAEYVMANGNDQVILCERGIRTYENTYTRSTLDLSAVPVLKEISALPVVVDPSHAVGRASLVAPMALAAAAAGADGLMIEVHGDPACALSDGAQSLTPDEFDDLMNRVRRIRAAL